MVVKQEYLSIADSSFFAPTWDFSNNKDWNIRAELNVRQVCLYSLVGKKDTALLVRSKLHLLRKQIVVLLGYVGIKFYQLKIICGVES